MRSRFLPAAATLMATMSLCAAADWPQWRADPGRTGSSTQNLPEVENLHLMWERKLPPLEPAFRDVRLQFDRGYEPVVLGNRMFVGSSRDDSVIAIDTETGNLLWRFVTEGPVRFAPVAWEENVYFGSDDGNLYCVNAADGKLRWKFQAVPSKRLVFGNRRLISTWPVRGGPVLHDGRLYFAAGVWSFEGAFVYALDAKTGKVVWLNDDCGYIYGIHPHNAVAFGGLAPQGYLLVNDDELVVPSSSAYPARFDLKTGKLIDFKLPAAGRKPGGWFVATGGDPGESKLGLLPESEVSRKRELLYERSINQKRHEGELKLEGSDGVRSSIWAGRKKISFAEKFPDVTGSIHTMLAADEKLFAVTEAGSILCYGDKPTATIKRHIPTRRVPASGETEFVEKLGKKHGLAILLGLPDLAITETLASQTELSIVAIDPAWTRVTSARRSLSESGLYGHRVSVRHGAPENYELPPYLAALIVCRDPINVETLNRISNSVRPFGGKLVVPRTGRIEHATLPGFHREIAGDLCTFTRSALPGSSNYTGDWQESADTLVRAPVGVLWFDDALSHFKRSPQPRFVDGVMISADKKWLDASTRAEKVDYRLRPAVFSDVYTGRILTKAEKPLLSEGVAKFDLENVQPSQYRPPKQKDAWKPKPPKSGTRKNPLTGAEEPRAFPKSYGCDGGFDYGNLYTMRSGTAAFYDKRLESGTINLSGPRSGCTNSVIPANGVLNVPYFYEGCTCSYPLPTALALVSMPKSHEQWASWGDVPAESLNGKIERVGINFGAPGDRMTDAGTLWLDSPNVGGPSPQVQVAIEPADRLRYEYRHSLWIKDGAAKAWPWVAGSAVIGAEKIEISGLKNGTYEATLFFCELEDAERRFEISVQDVVSHQTFTPSKEAGGKLTGAVVAVSGVKVKNGSFRIRLSPKEGETTVSGIELIRSGD